MASIASGHTVARALVRGLAIQGVAHAFCVPGESYLPVLDALRDSPIAVTTCRQEGGAAMMADAVGRATGSPGVCFVTRGPGAANAMTGLYIAAQDGTPMILFVGLVDQRWKMRGAWQELDLRDVFNGLAKWVTTLDDPTRIAELVSRAFHVAQSGRPGPVVIGLPRDLLSLPAEAADPPAPEAVEAGPDQPSLQTLQRYLGEAHRPVVIVGGGSWDNASRADLHRFAQRLALPVVTSYRRGALFDADHPSYAGDLGLGANPKLVARIKAADLVLAIGARLGEVPSQGYTLFDIPAPATRLVHVLPDPDELGRVYRPTLAIPSSPGRFAAGLEMIAAPDKIDWRDQTRIAHQDYLDWSQRATPQPGAVNLGEIMVWLRDRLEPDVIICNGAGGYAAWLHRFYRFREPNTHMAPACACMGYGPPAAVAMKRLHPGRQVVSISGDGDFLMNGQEFATMVQYNLAVVKLVEDNGSYGSIRLAQERDFPGRPIATDLVNPDFAAYARAFGGFGATVERTADFEPAFEAAQASGRPAIVHVRVDPECATPTATLSALRDRAVAMRG